MSNLGSRLKQAREARGIDLRELAAATKISVTALEALERNDYSRLPGGIFGRSFVRAYALAVDLDPDITVEEFVAALDESHRDAERNARKPEISADDRAFLARQQRAIRQLQLAIAVVLILVAAAAIWWFWRGRAV
jgi:cytoskeletal protein RodZ